MCIREAERQAHTNRLKNINFLSTSFLDFFWRKTLHDKFSFLVLQNRTQLIIFVYDVRKAEKDKTEHNTVKYGEKKIEIGKD